MPRTTRKYRLHKASGLAFVAIKGKRFYCGRYGTKESFEQYERILAEADAPAPPTPRHLVKNAPVDITVNEMLLRFVTHAKTYYAKNGRPTSEYSCIKEAIRPLVDLFGATPANEFSPPSLKVIYAAMVEAKLCRSTINKHVGRIKRAFKWAVAEGMISPIVSHGLTAVPGLRKGRTKAREPEPVLPVPDAFVDAIKPHVGDQVWAMVQLQRVTGMRPGEVILLRGIDIDMTGTVWVYRPGSHKTEHHGRERVVCLGPQAQMIVRPWLRAKVSDYLFQPREAMKGRKCSRPGERYSTVSYYHAVERGCRRAAVAEMLAAGLEKAEIGKKIAKGEYVSWSPNRLRHNHATAVRRKFGLEGAQVALGHAKADVTQLYAEKNHALAARIAQSIG